MIFVTFTPSAAWCSDTTDGIHTEGLKEALEGQESKVFLDVKEAYHFAHKQKITLGGRLWGLTYAAALLDEYIEDDTLPHLAKKYDVPLRDPLYTMRDLWAILSKKIKEELLYDVLMLECQHAELLAYTERVGVRLDIPKIKDMTKKVMSLIDSLYFKKERSQDEEKDLATLKKAYSSFLVPYIQGIKQGSIHTSFAPLPTGTYGTVSGRTSSYAPCLQQVPAYMHLYDPDIPQRTFLNLRSLFIPESGAQWGSIDYSQIEFRVLLHYAQGPMAEKMRRVYRKDIFFDIHARLAKDLDMPRDSAKGLLFSFLYGAGTKRIAASIGATEEDALAFQAKMHRIHPYIKGLYLKVFSCLEKDGYVRSISGRKHRMTPTTPRYTFANRLLQGTAADIFKRAMLCAWKDGVFSVLTPHIFIHDEVDISVPNTEEGQEAFAHLADIMVKKNGLWCPLGVKCKKGPSWGELD